MTPQRRRGRHSKGERGDWGGGRWLWPVPLDLPFVSPMLEAAKLYSVSDTEVQLSHHFNNRLNCVSSRSWFWFAFQKRKRVECGVCV